MSVARRASTSARLPPVWLCTLTGGDEEQEIVLADPAMQVDDGCRDVLAECDFFRGHGELGRNGIAHFLRGETNSAHKRMADSQAAHDDVQRVRQLSGEAESIRRWRATDR